MKLFQNKMTALRHVLVAATMIVATTTTFAHVSLVSAIPAENASILSQPKNLTLNFGAEVMLMNIKLLDAQRRDVPLKYSEIIIFVHSRTTCQHLTDMLKGNQFLFS